MAQVPLSTNGLLQDQPSASAMNVALCRAIAAHDPRAAIRGRDTLAELMLDDAARASLKDPAIHSLILKKVTAFAPGTYEYFIARTAYLDAVVEQALRDPMPQIVLLGAGYDTRAHRFAALNGATTIFELDTPATQQHKRALLARAGVTDPERLVYVPIDFTRESLAGALARAGYSERELALFVWEGVTYYLSPQAVDQTLDAVRRHSPAGSTLCFDYMIAVADLADRFGAQHARNAMQATYTAEPLGFDLEPGAVADFLAARGFRVVEHLATADLERRYLTLEDGTLAAPMLDLFGLVRAVSQG